MLASNRIRLGYIFWYIFVTRYCINFCVIGYLIILLDHAKHCINTFGSSTFLLTQMPRKLV